MHRTCWERWVQHIGGPACIICRAAPPRVVVILQPPPQPREMGMRHVAAFALMVLAYVIILIDLWELWAT